LSQLIQQKLIVSAHDLSDGGLFVALAESGMAGGLGFDINTDAISGADALRLDARLFGEGQGRIVVSVSAEQQESFEGAVADSGVPCVRLGLVTEEAFVVDGQTIMTLAEARGLYDNALGKIMA
jgi:phosphoribosylformylglycinamidine synthase subunit PurL